MTDLHLKTGSLRIGTILPVTVVSNVTEKNYITKSKKFDMFLCNQAYISYTEYKYNTITKKLRD